MTRYVFLDTETTGISHADGHRIIEIAALAMENRRLTGEKFHSYFNPRRAIDAGAQKVHGISLDFLKDKPFFEDRVTELTAFLKDSTLVIHNAPFDVGFMNAEYQRVSPNFKLSDYCPIIDTLQIARAKYTGQKNSLDALCKRFNISLADRTFHGALLDTRLLADVYFALTAGQESMAFGDSSAQNTTKKVAATVAKKPLAKIHAVKLTDAEKAIES